MRPERLQGQLKRRHWAFCGRHSRRKHRTVRLPRFVEVCVWVGAGKFRAMQHFADGEDHHRAMVNTS